MAISVRADGHLWWAADGFHQAVLGLQSGWLEECISLMRTQQLRGTFGRHPGSTECSVDFLTGLPDLEELQLYDVELADPGGPHQLPQLRHLRISGNWLAIDLSRLRTLDRLLVEHRPKDHGFAELGDLT